MSTILKPWWAFCIEHGFILRLIEAMPMGDTGRNASIWMCSQCWRACATPLA